MRPRLVSVHASQEAADHRVAVTLDWGEDERCAEVTGTDAEALESVAARATLHAIEVSAPAKVKLSLLAVAAANMIGSQTVLCHVQVNGTGERFVGSVLVPGTDLALASARSVLNALNRHLTRLSR